MTELEKVIESTLKNINSEIENGEVIIKTDDDPLKLAPMKPALDKMYKPTLGFKEVSDLVSLSLYYEDLYHERQEIVSKTLIKSATNEIKPKVDVFREYADQLENIMKKPSTYNEDEIQTRIQHLNARINELC